MKIVYSILFIVAVFGCTVEEKDDRVYGTGIFKNASLVETDDAFLLDSICYSSGEVRHLIQFDMKFELSEETIKVLYRKINSFELITQKMSLSGVECKVHEDFLNDELVLSWIDDTDTLRIKTGVFPI